MGSQSFRLTNLIHLFFRSSSFGKEPLYNLSDSSLYNIFKPSSIKLYDTISLYTFFSRIYIFDYII